MIKGGVWRNTEDEILKAAVMKYGLNQWSRIASLLHRKSSKQCKARWYEWLDPSIKKTEWSREEEEKLLHLTKLMPTQWRTIAPIVGRTAAQCLEHYEYLINKNLNTEDGDDLRKLKPGEIDPAPETKPARPDPIDMDEDEIEMLSEARARLANTQGKKAKRKAREKQLEEARRLASLQKRRELKAAGIEMKKRKKKRGRIDYNAEIPFEKQPAPGFYDTSQEVINPDDPNFRRLRQDHLDNVTRREQEERARQKDKQKMKDKEISSLLGNQRQSPVRKRSKLVLPSPQITDRELEEVVKVGQATQMLSIENAAGEDSLMSDYSDAYVTPRGLLGPAARTPMPSEDRVMREALNIMEMTNVDTPLKGGLNTPLQTDFKGGVTPQHTEIQTPNTVLTTPALKAYAHQDGAPSTPGLLTPRSSIGTTPGATPVHDKLNINRYDATPSNMAAEKLQIRGLLADLPRPKNDFEVVLPGDEEMENMNEQDDDESAAKDPDFVEDAADIEARKQQELDEIAQKKLEKRHTAVKVDLPRPTAINETIVRSNTSQLDDVQMAEEIIKKEMLCMLHYDALNYPTPTQIPGKSKKTGSVASHMAYLRSHPYDEVEPEDLQEAKELLDEEVRVVQEANQHKNVPIDVFNQVWRDCYARLLFLPSENRYTRVDRASKKERMESLEKQLENNRAHMTQGARSASKIEKKLKILTAGLQSRNNLILKQIAETYELRDKSLIELKTFEELLRCEQGAVNKRMEAIQRDVEVQVKREGELQDKYRSLLSKLSEVELDGESQSQMNGDS